MKNKIYPAIYKAVHNNEYLYADNDNYYSYEREAWNKSGNCDDHENDINITREYLANTYGKVKSKEHAEFIFELAKLHGFDVVGSTNNAKSFEFSGDSALVLYEIPTDIFANNEESRLITIPLPPKQIQTATSEEEFEMQQIMKNNGDNLVLGCDDSNCEEWPCANDEVEYIGCKWKVAAKYKHMLMLVTPDDCSFAVAEIKEVKKPKTPEEELRDELDECISDFQCQYHEREDIEYERLAGYILSKYNITKKPQ